ncbi:MULTISPECIES: hypothetical protein [Amycolatopsis]|uniref:DUF4267 domain-containing protein n=2 Tax=Amycolatopsis TaxID=1813 RepID=A0A1I4DBU2_9PSEU|nr:hypothetical protein [Amycolatopsis sacchari]SFK90240.1 hypothetical protein SAMN05421835_14327 [Amycolatopsis sacchari]
MSVITRLLGVATVGIGAAIAVRPGLLAHPCGLAEPDGSLSRSTKTLVVAIGARDVASGLAMACARSPEAQDIATGVRIASDVGDAINFGLTLPNRDARRKAVAAASAWALVCGLSRLRRQRCRWRPPPPP